MKEKLQSSELQLFMKVNKIKGVELAEYLGVTTGFISSILHGRKDFPQDKIGKLYTNSFGWDVSVLDDSIPTLEHEPHHSFSPCPAPDENDQSNLKVPLLPLDAKAGSLNDFVMSVQLQDCEKITSPIRNIDFAITVKGDSMSPKIPSGAKIFIKKIDHTRFVEWGEIYVLDTCNGTVVKKLMPTEDAQVIKCVSLNADYPPFDVSLMDVYGIYQVLLVMTEM